MSCTTICDRALLRVRTQLPENMVPNPTPDQLEEASLAALGSFNLVSPVSDVSFDTLASSTITSELLVRWTAYWIVFNVYSGWVGEGQELAFEGLVAIDRIDRYRSLLDLLKETLEDDTANAKKLLKLAPSSQNATKVRLFNSSRSSNFLSKRIK